MTKYYIYHTEDDSYVDAEEVSLTTGGELCFLRENKLIACYHRGCWSYFKEIQMEPV
jgi:hypothetical protein